jgi:hypothetical protein
VIARALCLLPLAACGRISFDSSQTGDGSVDSRVIDPQTVTLALDRYSPSAGLSDFVLPVFLSSARIDRALLAPDASDLYFTETTGALLPHEIEQLGDASAPLIAWVRVTDYNASTVLQLHYGGETRDPSTDPTWPASFLGVWHMGNANDAGVHANNGTLHNTDDATGLIGPALHFHPGDDDWMTVPDSSSLTFAFNQFTLSGWVKLDTMPAFYAAIFGRQLGDSTDNDFNINVFNGVATGSESFTSTTAHEVSGGAVSVGAWHNIAFTNTGTQLTVYVDGVLTATEPESRVVAHSANPILFGADRNDTNGTTPVGIADSDFIDGTVDEVRLENVARDANWIGASIAAAQDMIISYP